MAVLVGGVPRKIGLALSGGGFRASIFHLGVLRRLHELGLLERIDYISSVSGGSITAGLYCFLKPRTDAEFRAFEARLLNGIKRDPRKYWVGILALLFAPLAVMVFYSRSWWPLLVWSPVLFLPWGRIKLMAQFFKRFFLLGSSPLSSAFAPPPHSPPHLLINAACLNTGKGWVFSPKYVGEDLAQPFAESPTGSRVDPARVPLAHAIGASACVPGLFYPYRFTLQVPFDLDGRPATKVDLVDGGAYDNQGLGIYFTPDPNKPDWCDYVIGSDAAQLLPPEKRPFWRIAVASTFQVLLRAANMWAMRAREEAYLILRRKRPAEEIRQYAVFHIGSDKGNSPPYGLPEGIVQRLGRIRTDLDAFDDLEIRTLMYHGYSLVNHRIINYCWEILLEDYPQVGPFVRGLRPEAPDQQRPLDWAHLPGYPDPAGLPPLDDWATFNRNLTKQHDTILTDPSWNDFLSLNMWELDRAENKAIIERAQAHLDRSSVRLDPLRALLRLYVRSVEGWPMARTQREVANNTTTSGPTGKPALSWWRRLWKRIHHLKALIAPVAALIGYIVGAYSLPEKVYQWRTIRQVNESVRKADEMYRQGDYRGALAIYDNALVLSPDKLDLMLKVNRAQVEATLSKIVNIRLYRELTPEEDQEVGNLVGRAESLAAIRPRDVELRRIVALARLVDGKTDEAIAILGTELLPVNSTNARLHADLALAYDMQRKHDQAEQLYSAAIRLEPRNYRFYLYRGNNRFRRADPEVGAGTFEAAIRKVLEDYEEAIKSYDRHWGTHINKGVAHCFLGEYDRALHEYDRAMQLNKRAAQVYYHKGNIYLIRGQNHEAIREFEKSIALDRSDWLSYKKEAVALLRLGRKAEARRVRTVAEALQFKLGPGWKVRHRCE